MYISATPSRKRMRLSELPRLTVEIGGASWQERVLIATVVFSSLAFSLMSCLGNNVEPFEVFFG